MAKLYTVEVMVIGTVRVQVEATSADEARDKAEGCAFPMAVKDWSYDADRILHETEELVGVADPELPEYA